MSGAVSTSCQGSTIKRTGASARGESRRLRLLKKAGFFGSYPPGTSIIRATSQEDLRSAYTLVHDAFVERGYIKAVDCRMRIRCFEALPETATFVAHVKGEIAGVLSVVPDTAGFGLPADTAFKVEIDQLRKRGRRLCEGTNWVMAEKYRNTPIMTELMRCAFAHAMSEGYTDFLGTVSPGHVRFYSLLAFEPISPVRSYSKDAYDPVVVVCLSKDVVTQRVTDAGTEGDDNAFLVDYYVDSNPYHDTVQEWAVVAQGLFKDPEALAELFVQDSHFLDRCTKAERKAIKRFWGEEVYAQVVATPVSVTA